MANETNDKIEVEVGEKGGKLAVSGGGTSRLINAAADFISPVTQSLGALGDAVRQFRIHRELTAAIVLERTIEELKKRGQKVHPVPPKTLGPILEGASLEEPDDEEMIVRWSELLATAASGELITPRFATILSELRSSDARVLEELCAPKVPDKTSADSEILDFVRDIREPFNAVIEDLFGAMILRDITKIETHQRPFDAFAAYVDMLFSGQGSEVEFWMLSFVDDRHFFVKSKGQEIGSKQESLDILGSLGLVRSERLSFELDRSKGELSFYQVTSLGVALIEACSPSFRMELARQRAERKARAKS